VFAADDQAFYYGNGVVTAHHRYILNYIDLSEFYGESSGYPYTVLDGMLFWVPRPCSDSGCPPVNYFPYNSGLSCPDSAYDPLPGSYNPTDIAAGGWPVKTSDQCASKQPIISDYCLAPGNDTNTADLDPTTGHTWHGKVASVNVGFADGHVETHPTIRMMWHMLGNGDKETWFY
jgi:prepilin-type processing-associated H-X9-DG protein